MAKKPELTREQVLAELDAIADSWGTPRLSQQCRDNLSNDKQLRAMHKRLVKQGERLGSVQ